MSIKNTNQPVTQSYYNNFIAIFGEKKEGVTYTGTYKIDNKTNCLIKIDDSTPRHVKEKIEPLMNEVRNLDTINIKKKEG